MYNKYYRNYLEDKLKTKVMENDGNIGTHHPSKEQVCTCTNKDKHHIPGQKINIWEREKIKVFDVIEQVPRQKRTLARHISEI